MPVIRFIDIYKYYFCTAKLSWNVQTNHENVAYANAFHWSIIIFLPYRSRSPEWRVDENECVPKMYLVIVFRTRASHNEIRHDDVPWILLLTLKQPHSSSIYVFSIHWALSKFQVDVKSIHTFCLTRNTIANGYSAEQSTIKATIVLL